MTVYKLCKIFVTGNSAQKGIIISGDAGTGKSYYVQQAFVDTDTTERVDYNKSKSFTAAAFYVKLFLNRNPGDVTVFDDCGLEHLSSKDFKEGKYGSAAMNAAKGLGSAADTLLVKGPKAAMFAARNRIVDGEKKASGGMVSSASNRADGCCTKGKTRGKMV